MVTRMFMNDIKRSVAFFTKVGYKFDHQFRRALS